MGSTDGHPGFHDAPVRPQVGDQRIGDRLAAAHRNRPTRGMGQRGQQQTRAGRDDRRHRRNRVRGNAGEQRPGVLAAQRRPQRGALLENPQAEQCRGGDARRQRASVPEEQSYDICAAFHQRAEQTPPGITLIEAITGALEVPIGDRGAAPRQRVGVGDVGDHQLDPARPQVEIGEERRGQRQGVNGRADVVGDLRELRIRQGPRPTADGALRFEHLHLQPGSGADHCGSQPVGSAADDGDVHGYKSLPASLPAELSARAAHL